MVWVFGDKRVADLGQGASGKCTVWRCRKSRLYYVVKTYLSAESYESKDEYKARTLVEYHMLKQMDHINIIRPRYFYISFFGSTVNVVLEAGSRQNLHAIVKNCRCTREISRQLLCFWKQMCDAVNYLHERHVCHRDIKLENVVILPDLGLLKLIDFSTAVHLGSEGSNEAIGLVGTKKFCAPETISRIRYDGKAADIWSLGVLLYYMMARRFPWKSAHIQYTEYAEYLADTLSLGGSISSQTRVILLSTLEPDPILRISSYRLVNNNWVQSIAQCSHDRQCGEDHVTTFNLHYDT